MLSLILYLSTTVFFPIYIIVLIIPLLLVKSFIFKKYNGKIIYNSSELLGYIFIGGAACFIATFNILNGPVVVNMQDKSLLGDIPFIFLILVSIILGKFLSLKDLRIIQALIVVEIFIGVLEYISGVPTFFKNITVITELADSDILYQKKVFGVSANSSALAAKVVYLATISFMIDKLRINKNNNIDKFIGLVVIVGLFITFNRTAILAIFLSFLFFYGRSIRNLILIFLPLISIILYKWEDIYEQLTRGKNTVDYSGRDQIFSYFYNFWMDNILLGNRGTKLWWDSYGSVWHAHNSYLEFLASNGLLVFLFFVIGWLLIFRKASLIVFPILIYSISQYGFLWGLSFYDVVLAAIIYIYIYEKPVANTKEL
ncbi:O-antigen ligase family protein [Acinetobacter venetianus]|uniref:O-antigen ligase family protein n=1 Tax=Acinetobacter venetianus TaxID=52133 RepID=UPI00289AA975|nr:O-antigen ligase family protein [Acinetobacter venetianus]